MIKSRQYEESGNTFNLAVIKIKCGTFDSSHVFPDASPLSFKLNFLEPIRVKTGKNI